MRTRCNGLLIGLLLAVSPAAALANDPAPAVAPPPPTMDDPGQPATAESIKPNDPRLKPLPPESAPTAPATQPEGPPKTDGDPTYAPRKPTDDAFHPPAKKPDQSVSADGDSVRVHTESNGDRIEEYRRGGRLTRVRVKPANGPGYEIHDNNGDGHIDHHDANGDKVTPVQWTLFEWH